MKITGSGSPQNCMWKDVVSRSSVRGDQDFTEKCKAVSLLAECIVKIAATLEK